MKRLLILMLLAFLLAISGCKRVDVPTEEETAETADQTESTNRMPTEQNNNALENDGNETSPGETSSESESVVFEVKENKDLNLSSLEKAIVELDLRDGLITTVDDAAKIINFVYVVSDMSFYDLDYGTIRNYYNYDVWPSQYSDYQLQIGLVDSNRQLMAAHSFDEATFDQNYYYEEGMIPYDTQLQLLSTDTEGAFKPTVAKNLGDTVDKITLGKTNYSLYQTYSDAVFTLNNGTERLLKYDFASDTFALELDGFDFQMDLTDESLIFELISTLEKTIVYNSFTDQIDVTELSSGEVNSYDIDAFSFYDVIITEDELPVYPVKDRASFIDAVGHFRKLAIAPELAQADMRFDEAESNNPYFSIAPYDTSIYRVRGMVIEGTLDTPIPFMTSWIGNVLTFSDCADITLRNLDLGHMTVEACYGDVIYLSRTENVHIDQCILFGSGINGITLNHNSSAYVSDSRIWDCSRTGVYIIDSESQIALDNCLIEKTPHAFEFENAFCEFGQLDVTNSRINAVMYPFYDFRYNDRFEQIGLARLNTVEDEMIFENVLYSPGNMVNFEQVSTFFKEDGPSDYIYIAPVDESGSYRVNVDLSYEGERQDFDREMLETLCHDLPEQLFDVTVLFNQDWRIRIYDKSEGYFLAEFNWNTWRKEISELKVDSELTEAFFGMKSIDVYSEILTVFEHNNVIGEVATYDEVQPPFMTNAGMMHQIDAYYYSMETELDGNLLYSILYNQSKDTYHIETAEGSFDYDGSYDGPVLQVLNGINDIISTFQPTSEVMISGKAYVAATYEYSSINDFKTHLNTYMTPTMAEWYVETMDLLDKDGILYTTVEPFNMRYGIDSYILPFDAPENNTVEVITLVNDEDGYLPVTMIFDVFGDQWKLIGIKK